MAAESWDQWRGPNRDGRISGAKWPLGLEETRLKRRWRLPLDPSYSGPVMNAERVFTTETVDKKREQVTALRRSDGSVVWKRDWEGSMSVPFFARSNGDWIRATPALEGDTLYVAGMRDVLVALNTGVRVGEILSLKWEDVHLNKNRIEIKHTKNGEDRTIPVNSFLNNLLKSMPRDQIYVFVNRDGKKIGSIKTAWNNTMIKANIEYLRFHDLRHTVATRLSMAKVPESVIAMILGHKRTSITSRYINPHWQEMVEAIEELGKLCHRFDNREDNSSFVVITTL